MLRKSSTIWAEIKLEQEKIKQLENEFVKVYKSELFAVTQEEIHQILIKQRKGLGRVRIRYYKQYHYDHMNLMSIREFYEDAYIDYDDTFHFNTDGIRPDDKVYINQNDF